MLTIAPNAFSAVFEAAKFESQQARFSRQRKTLDTTLVIAADIEPQTFSEPQIASFHDLNKTVELAQSLLNNHFSWAENDEFRTYTVSFESAKMVTITADSLDSLDFSSMLQSLPTDVAALTLATLWTLAYRCELMADESAIAAHAGRDEAYCEADALLKEFPAPTDDNILHYVRRANGVFGYREWEIDNGITDEIRDEILDVVRGYLDERRGRPAYILRAERIMSSLSAHRRSGSVNRPANLCERWHRKRLQKRFHSLRAQMVEMLQQAAALLEPDTDCTNGVPAYLGLVIEAGEPSFSRLYDDFFEYINSNGEFPELALDYKNYSTSDMVIDLKRRDRLCRSIIAFCQTKEAVKS